ncbi:MAG: DUF4347 domain-containing protein [Xenococcus sp. (in: cyanobacteria)]
MNFNLLRTLASELCERSNNSELIFIDPAVESYQDLIKGARSHTEVIVLDSLRDGVVQISEVLTRYRNLSSLHLVSHGSSGSLQLGIAQLSLDNINKYQQYLQDWAQALEENANILIYGCNVAQGDRGLAFVEQLSQITGTDVAASSTLTGCHHQGGDWNLDVKTSQFNPVLAFYRKNIENYGFTLMIDAFSGIGPVDEIDSNQVGAVKINVRPGGNIKTSTYNTKSFTVENIGDKRIAAIYFDITDALYPDSVFDPLGLAGDTAFRGLTFFSTGGTGAFEPGSDEQLVPFYGTGGVEGYEGMLVTFDPSIDGGYNPSEIIQFGVDVDPNSIVGLPKKPLDINGNSPHLQSWDIAGVSGAELINSKVHVLFTDGTTAVGELMGDGSQGGSVAVASQGSINKEVILTVNDLSEGESGSYSQNNIQVLVSGQAGDRARVVLTKGFIQPFDYIDTQGNPVNLSEKFANSSFPANNAIEFQTVDVLLDGTLQDITSLFNFDAPGGTLSFPGDDRLPIGLVASIIDEEELPLGSVTEPIYLIHEDANANTAPISIGIADVSVPEGADNTVIALFDIFEDAQDDDTALTYEVVENTNADLFATVPAIDVEGNLILDYTATGIGSSKITVSATDTEGLFVEETFNVTVIDPRANTPPTSSGILDVSVTEGADNTVIALFDVFDDAQDADTDLTYEVVENTNAALFATVPAIDVEGNLTLDYAATETGTSQITIHATDTEGLFVEETFNVTVSDTSSSGNGIRIEAEDYKAGTNGVEYYDNSTGNKGGAYRPDEPVDIQVTKDEGGGFNVGWIQAGEWLTYDIDITAAGTYDLVVRVASKKGNASFTITVGGQSYTQSVASTGGNQTWQDVVIPGVNLSAGLQELRMDINAKGFNFNYFELISTNPANGNAPISNNIADLVVLEGAEDSLIDLYATFEDDQDPDEALNYAVTNNNNPGLVATNIFGGNLTLDYSVTGTGTADISVRATDTDGASSITNFTATVVTPQADDGVIRINAGGGDVYDDEGNLFQADTYFFGGQGVSVSGNQAIANTKYDALYQTQRQGANFSYSIPVPNGNYLLNAHIVDSESTDFNQRVFDLSVEGESFYDNLDIFGEIQNAFLDGQNTAKVIQGPDKNTTIIASVSDGSLDINFNASLNNASIAGLEIIPLDQPGVLIQETNGNTQVTEGASVDTYTVVLTAPPTDDVTVNLDFDSSQVTVNVPSLIFNANNWSQSQTVVVTPVDDELLEGPHTALINHTISAITGSNYEGITEADGVSVTIIDNDAAAGEISFNQQLIATQNKPSTGAFGQDGRLYIASTTGSIIVYTLNDDYTVDESETEIIDLVDNLSNKNITGIAFNPYDTVPRIYVSHNQFYANNGGKAFPPTDFSPYSGQVSVLEKVNGEWALQPLITGIGVSNHNHGVNGLAFDNNGDLFITSGSNTNAGIADTKIGGIDESPFTAAILKAEITKPGFNGDIDYSLDLDNLPPEFIPPENLGFDPADSQYWGGYADIVPGVDVSVYASGLRNPYDLVFTTDGLLYATENNANGSFGDVSTGPDTQEPFGQEQPEELNLITENSYYGHPNRNRGRIDFRQNIYFDSPVDLPADGYTAPIGTFQGSTNGITEYRATTFDSQLRGNLLAQKYKKDLFSVDLSADGQQVDEIIDLNKVANLTGGTPDGKINVARGLDVITGPGGAILSIDFTRDELTVAVPNDSSVTEPTAYDIYPWRAPVQGGSDFVIGGVNFDTNPGDTRVFIGSQEANAVEIAGIDVSETRIRGIIPDLTSQPNELLDIFIKDSGGNVVSFIDDAFQPLFG